MGEENPEKRNRAGFLEEVFEKFLWTSRLVTLKERQGS